MSLREYAFSPAALRCVETNKPEQKSVDAGTVISPVLWFDGTTREYANGVFRVPTGINTSGTVTFRVWCLPRTGAAAKNVGWYLEHVGRGSSETLDASYIEEASGAASINATTNGLTEVTWTETVANLGWAAGDLVPVRWSRDNSVSNNLTGDAGLVWAQIDVPITT